MSHCYFDKYLLVIYTYIQWVLEFLDLTPQDPRSNRTPRTPTTPRQERLWPREVWTSICHVMSWHVNHCQTPPPLTKEIASGQHGAVHVCGQQIGQQLQHSVHLIHQKLGITRELVHHPPIDQKVQNSVIQLHEHHDDEGGEVVRVQQEASPEAAQQVVLVRGLKRKHKSTEL